MFQKPSAAKRLHFDVIPRAVDEYLSFLEAFPRQAAKEQLGNPVWHIHLGNPPAPERIGAEAAPSFAMLLNLVAVANSEDPAVLWAFLRKHAPDASPQHHPRLDALVKYAVAYFRDFVRPAKTYRAADDVERAILARIGAMLASLPAQTDAAEVQTALYDIARSEPRYHDLKAKGATPERPGVSNDFFSMLYQVLLGENRGPRFGSFAVLFGLENTAKLIASALAGDLARDHAAFLAARADSSITD